MWIMLSPFSLCSLYFVHSLRLYGESSSICHRMTFSLVLDLRNEYYCAVILRVLTTIIRIHIKSISNPFFSNILLLSSQNCQTLLGLSWLLTGLTQFREVWKQTIEFCQSTIHSHFVCFFLLGLLLFKCIDGIAWIEFSAWWFLFLFTFSQVLTLKISFASFSNVTIFYWIDGQIQWRYKPKIFDSLVVNYNIVKPIKFLFDIWTVMISNIKEKITWIRKWITCFIQNEIYLNCSYLESSN